MRGGGRGGKGRRKRGVAGGDVGPHPEVGTGGGGGGGDREGWGGGGERKGEERERFWTRGKFQALCGGLRGKDGARVDGWDRGL